MFHAELGVEIVSQLKSVLADVCVKSLAALKARGFLI